MKISQNKIKQKLKDYYRYLDSDFYTDGEDIYMNCQDNVGISVRDMFETLEQERKIKEGYAPHLEYLADETGIFPSSEVLDYWNFIKTHYIMGTDPYEQDNESSSYGATLKVRTDGTIEIIKYEK